MIHAHRNNPPPSLLEWNSQWSVDCKTTSCDKGWRKFSRSQDYVLLKETLNDMYHNKCCFCEDKTTSVEVEHFFPKSKYKEKLFDYRNLHLICSRCNRIKGQREAFNLIDPSNEDPEMHVFFRLSPEIESATEKGKHTITSIRLNDENMKNLRQLKINNVKSHVKTYLVRLQGCHDVHSLDFLKKEIESFIFQIKSPKEEYSLMTKNIFLKMLENLSVIIDKKMKLISDTSASV